MPSYSKNEVVLVRYPFSDLSSAKVRPTVFVNSAHASRDILIVPLTSKTASLLAGEFVLAEWRKAGFEGCLDESDLVRCSARCVPALSASYPCPAWSFLPILPLFGPDEGTVYEALREVEGTPLL